MLRLNSLTQFYWTVQRDSRIIMFPPAALLKHHSQCPAGDPWSYLTKLAFLGVFYFV